MATTAAEIVLTQEVKLQEGYPCEAAEQAARNAKWKLSVEPCLITKAGGRSAGTAVATRNYIGMTKPKAVEATQRLHAPGRFAMRRVAAMGKGGINCGTPYLNSSVGITARCNLDLLETIAFTLASITGPWMLGGDWNCTPPELEATGWVKKVGGIIHAPQSATCNGKVYDFFVVSANVSSQVRGTFVIGDAGLTPHSPVRLLFKGGKKKVMVRQLKAQASIPAVLPHGPLQEQTTALDPLTELYKPTNQHYAELTKRTLQILQGLSGDRGTDTNDDKRGNWTDGPKFVWRNLAAPKASDETKSSPVSRAWKRTASWLRVLRDSRSVKLANAATWKLLHYDHQLNVVDPAMMEEAAAFRAWRALLNEQVLATKPWVQSFLAVAAKEAERAADRAAKAATVRFATWIADGPANGLKRQHLFSRSVSGWVADQTGGQQATNLSELVDQVTIG